MRLKTLRLHGFKSFADRTTLEFRDGVTAIVGSNGCGKSNIADAVRWVLGEQRASAMRGARMEEVIFQGTARRRPLNLAEVSLNFENEDGRIPIPQTEIEISRKVFREGGSEYFLNRNACRLRDVQGLLRDTGLGSNAYAIIEATMIETLLSDRAEERRALFEEAAGIGRYKDSRRAAERRLEAAEADLRRLDDLIAEVDSKVRTLSRQRRKAERHGELRARRLDLEVALATYEISRLETDLGAAERDHARLDEEERVAAAERGTAEAQLEERRIEAADVGRQRSRRAAELDDVRSRLNDREREIMLSEERRNHLESRLSVLLDEKDALLGGAERSEAEIARLMVERERAYSEVAVARDAVETMAARTSEVRQTLSAERSVAEAAAVAARELASEIATYQADRAGAERAGRDARERLIQVTAELERVEHELGQMAGQTELWETQVDEIRATLVAVAEAVEVSRQDLTAARSREERAREELRLAEDRLATLTAQVSARESLEREYEGFTPAVAAIMASRSAFPGVRGPLADFVANISERERLEAVERYLGTLLQALVVDDFATVRAIRSWFREEWTGGGSLTLLPLEAIATIGESEIRSDGSSWVEVLLEHFAVVAGDPLSEFVRGANRIGRNGEVVDARGVVRLPERGEGQGILARREALEVLRAEADRALRQREGRLSDLDAVRSVLRVAEGNLREAEERRAAVESRLKHMEMDAAAHQGRRSSYQDERERLKRSGLELTSIAAQSETRTANLDHRIAELGLELDEATSNEVAARSRLKEFEEQWDQVRDGETEARVHLAGAESELRELDRALEAWRRDRSAALARIGALESEADETKSRLEQLKNLRENASGEMADLFVRRDEETGALAVLDARLAEVDSELAELGERARVARRRESEAKERRHQLDLTIAETRSRIERVRERLEAEWGRPWTALVKEADSIDGEPDGWKEELRTIASQIDTLGPVNMLAVEEHAEEESRLRFLREQRADLVEARDNLVTAIRQINKTAREVFERTFDAVRMNFRRTFESLFVGGECNLTLSDPGDPLESAIEIHASPKGKKTQRIHLLSGGERTLTALALLFALYLVKPSPFCVLDEVDAPLDESNVGRFLQLLSDFKDETQFIVITHNPRTMEAADWVYGVTMEDPGVSTIVGVELTGAWPLDSPVSGAAV